MTHKAISRWTCDNCKMVADLGMKLIGSSRGTGLYEAASIVGWSQYDGMMICLNCANAMIEALVALRKEITDANEAKPN